MTVTLPCDTLANAEILASWINVICSTLNAIVKVDSSGTNSPTQYFVIIQEIV